MSMCYVFQLQGKLTNMQFYFLFAKRHHVSVKIFSGCIRPPIKTFFYIKMYLRKIVHPTLTPKAVYPFFAFLKIKMEIGDFQVLDLGD
jgi:hypothetical protein